MSRSGYSDECENLGLWRGAVQRAMNGKRGRAFLQEMLDAMDAMSIKRLIMDELIDANGECCAVGVVCKARGIDISEVKYNEPRSVGAAVGIARAMAAEIEFLNDEYGRYSETPEERFVRMRAWTVAALTGYNE